VTAKPVPGVRFDDLIDTKNLDLRQLIHAIQEPERGGMATTSA
jgi:hypothetical protein